MDRKTLYDFYIATIGSEKIEALAELVHNEKLYSLFSKECNNFILYYEEKTKTKK